MAAADLQKMMANAQRMLGSGGGGAPPMSTTPTSAKPRSMSTQISGNGNMGPMARGGSAAVKITSPPPAVNAPPAFTFTSPLIERDANIQAKTESPKQAITTPATVTSPSSPEPQASMTSLAAGPSLKGNPDQLKEAREFMQTSTLSSTRPSRARLVSKGRDSSASSSPRTSVARDLYTSTARMPPPSTFSFDKPAPCASPPAAPATNEWQGYASLHDRPTVTPTVAPTPAPTNSRTPSAFANLASKTPQIDLAASTTLAAPEKKTTSAGLLNRQMADINKNIQGERANDVPPHMRAAARAATAAAATPTATTQAPATQIIRPASNAATPITEKKTVESSFVAPVAMPIEPLKVAPVVQKKPVDSLVNSPAVVAAQPEKVVPAVQLSTTSSVPTGTKADPITISENVTTVKTAATQSGKGSQGTDVVATLQREVKALTARMAEFEKANISLEKQVEKLEEGDERRRFLGTDSAKTPYKVNVTCSNGKTIRVQSSRDFIVANFIRRARLDAGLTPDDCKNPRVLFNGKVLGQGQMLGEEGILEESSVQFVFDVPDEEEEL